MKKILFLLLLLINLHLFVNYKYQPVNKKELIKLIKDESIYLGDIDTFKITDLSLNIQISNFHWINKEESLFS